MSLLLVAWGGGAEPDKPIDFNRDIRPVLAKNCFACHGPDDKHREAGFRLDERAVATQPADSGAVPIVPGKPDESELVRRTGAPDEATRMPPKGSGHVLTPQQIQTLRRWVAQGAPYAEHWSFVPPARPRLPKVNDPAWCSVAIDRFVLARLDAAGLRPSPEADRYALIRRLSLDLRGLPPTPAEADAFVNDRSPAAYERLVDRLLADPAYGERWARMWLDLARYADSAGFGSDPLRTIWRYRDWVIDALNANMPYDQFTIEQLAGDLLPNPTLAQRIATAMHRNTMTNTEGGTDDEEFRVAAVMDRVDTTMQVWMGLTMGCAKCHSHKFDPISQREYYQFFALFNQTADTDQPNESPTLEIPAPELKEGKVTVPIMQELPLKQRRATHVLTLANFLNKGERVEAGLPKKFHLPPQGTPLNRLVVAQWLVDRKNPLTARVAVNRMWAQLFGVGLVETEEDFGTQGELPTHPELLDWLAVEFMDSGWDQKALLRTIVTSATYRQSSRVTPEHVRRDPRNRLLSRGPRFRLEAEMVRDQALALSGLLSRKSHGPSVYPPQPDGLWQAAFNGERTWPTDKGEDRYRRGLYTFWRRTVPYPSMSTFDAPSREICSVRRIRTNTPLQSFVTLNDPVFVEAAQALARRIVREGGATVEGRARLALGLCLVRPPEPKQVAQVVELFRSELAHYRQDSKSAISLATDPLGPPPAGLDIAELAAWTVVANVLLNMDGVLVKG